MLESPPLPEDQLLDGRRARWLPNLIVITILIAVAVWGHSTDWRFGIPRSDTTSPVSVDIPIRVNTDTLTFISAADVEKAGIDVVAVWEAAMEDVVAASGEVRFDERRMARLSARAPGTASQVVKRVGDRVRVGDILAVIDSSVVGKAKADLQQAIVQLRLKQTTLRNLESAGGAVLERQRIEAQAALRDSEVQVLGAEQGLGNLGLPVRAAEFREMSLEDISRHLRSLGLEQNTVGNSQSSNLLPLRSSTDGVVLSVDVVSGEVVESGRVLFVIVDPTQLWVRLHVNPVDAHRVQMEQAVRFRPDGSTTEFTGTVKWIGTAADETTRAVPVRAEVANADGKLRASTFGAGRIIVRQIPSAIVAPQTAMIEINGTPHVFTRDANYLKPDGPKAFHLRTVKIGARDGANVEIVSGLKAGEVVAAKGIETLKNQWLRANRKETP